MSLILYNTTRDSEQTHTPSLISQAMAVRPGKEWRFVYRCLANSGLYTLRESSASHMLVEEKPGLRKDRYQIHVALLNGSEDIDLGALVKENIAKGIFTACVMHGDRRNFKKPASKSEKEALIKKVGKHDTVIHATDLEKEVLGWRGRGDGSHVTYFEPEKGICTYSAKSPHVKSAWGRGSRPSKRCRVLSLDHAIRSTEGVSLSLGNLYQKIATFTDDRMEYAVKRFGVMLYDEDGSVEKGEDIGRFLDNLKQDERDYLAQKFGHSKLGEFVDASKPEIVYESEDEEIVDGFEGAVKIADTRKIEWPSSEAGKVHYISERKVIDNGEVTRNCSCPDYIFRAKGDENYQCRHINEFLDVEAENS